MDVHEIESKLGFSTVDELKELLNLEKLPRKIECYDISNLSGTNMVAGMCVLKDGIINKKLYKEIWAQNSIF